MSDNKKQPKAANAPDFNAYTVAEGKEKKRWIKIGVAFHKEQSEFITIKLDALPVNGEIVLKHQNAEDNTEAGQ